MKKIKFRFSIGNKILAGFSSVVFLFIINAVFIFFTVRKIDKVIQHSSENVRPSKDAINEFILLVTRSKMLITNWVYLQTNEVDKNALRQLQKFEYPALKDKITQLMPLWESDSQRMLMDTVFFKFEQIAETQTDIMSQLVGFESYEDPITKLLAEDAIEGQIIPQTAELILLLEKIAGIQSTFTEASDRGLIYSTERLRNNTLIIATSTVLLGLLGAVLLLRTITKPINFLKKVVDKLGRGELVEEVQHHFGNDEIGEMALAMENLVSGLKQTTQFAEKIGNGNYQSSFQPLSDQDVLGNALLTMRANLAKVAEDDKKRNWATEGLAKFGEILRLNNNNLEKLADEVLKNLIKYLNVNQGALYIMDEVVDTEPTMSVMACYAWDKKKFFNQKVYKGEGLSGQAWLEGDTIFLTEVPQQYIKITSGLGDSNPTCVLIVPLKVNDEVYGVVELASFHVMEDYQIDFVEKIAETIASSISTVKINAKTQRLLEESQEMTEEMRAQEEEMRQNMEELQATQEEMERNQFESQSVLELFQNSIAIAEFDLEGRIIKVNENYLKLFSFKQGELLGEHHRIIVPKEERNSDEYRQLWRDLVNGVPHDGKYLRIDKDGKSVTVNSHMVPMKDRNGQIHKIIELAL